MTKKKKKKGTAIAERFTLHTNAINLSQYSFSKASYKLLKQKLKLCNNTNEV